MQQQERRLRAARRHHGLPHRRRRRRRSATRRSACCTAAISACRGRFKDYISTPKPNDYRSLHTGVIGPERPAHRDPDPHRARCTRSAELGVAAHWGYKQGGPSTDGPQYRWLRELLDILEHGARRRGIPRAHQARDVPGPGVLLHAQGRSDRPAARRHAGRFRLCRALARSATPASAPRSTAGMLPLRTQLANGDQVEIVTSQGADAVADLGALRRHRQGAAAHPPLHPHAAARAVPRARQLDPGRRPSARKATSSPRRRSTAC